MEIYKFVNLDNDDILLQKIIIDNSIYTVINKENGDILLKKNLNIKEYNYKNSIILDCLIFNEKINKLKYKSILEIIYKLINDGSKIIKNSTLNIKTIKKEDEGFYFLDTIGISIQGVDSNKCLLEICNQCIKNKIKIYIKIKLFDGNIINIDL